MKRQNISAMARANGVNVATAHNRILRGWSTEAATSMPAGARKSKHQYGKKSELVWAHLVANPLDRPADVARKTGVSYGYVYKLMSKVGTPREVFEAEVAAKADVTEDVSLEQFVKDDTSRDRIRNVVVGLCLVGLIIAWVTYG